MNSNKPITLPAEGSINRQTCIILAILGSVFCALFLVAGLLFWKMIPVLRSFFPSQLSPKPLPVLEHDRFDFPLFSIGAPDGPDWMYLPVQTGIAFERQEPTYNRLTVADAWSVGLSTTTNYSKKEFLKYACAYQIRLPEEDRYKEQQRDCDWWKKFPLTVFAYMGCIWILLTKILPLHLL